MDDDLGELLRTAGGDLVATRQAVEAGAPWPMAEVFDHSDEARWGPPEVLAHVSEMLPYWLGEVERILSGASDPVPFGRIGTDPLRIAIIGRDRSLPVGELYTRIEGDLGRWDGRLRTMSPDELDKVGLHPRLGEMTVAAVVRRMIVGHTTEHAAQLQELLAEHAPGG